MDRETAHPNLTIWILGMEDGVVRASVFARGDLPTNRDSVSVAFVTGRLEAARTALVLACDFMAASSAAELVDVDRNLLRHRAGADIEGAVDAMGTIGGAALLASGLAAFRIEGDEAAALKAVEARFETLLALKRARGVSNPERSQALSR